MSQDFINGVIVGDAMNSSPEAILIGFAVFMLIATMMACAEHPETCCIIIGILALYAAVFWIGKLIYEADRTTQIAVGATAGAIAVLAIIGGIIGCFVCGREIDYPKKIESDKEPTGKVAISEVEGVQNTESKGKVERV